MNSKDKPSVGTPAETVSRGLQWRLIGKHDIYRTEGNEKAFVPFLEHSTGPACFEVYDADEGWNATFWHGNQGHHVARLVKTSDEAKKACQDHFDKLCNALQLPTPHPDLGSVVEALERADTLIRYENDRPQWVNMAEAMELIQKSLATLRSSAPASKVVETPMVWIFEVDEGEGDHEVEFVRKVDYDDALATLRSSAPASKVEEKCNYCGLTESRHMTQSHTFERQMAPASNVVVDLTGLNTWKTMGSSLWNDEDEYYRDTDHDIEVETIVKSDLLTLLAQVPGVEVIK